MTKFPLTNSWITFGQAGLGRLTKPSCKEPEIRALHQKGEEAAKSSQVDPGRGKPLSCPHVVAPLGRRAYLMPQVIPSQETESRSSYLEESLLVFGGWPIVVKAPWTFIPLASSFHGDPSTLSFSRVQCVGPQDMMCTQESYLESAFPSAGSQQQPNASLEG